MEFLKRVTSQQGLNLITGPKDDGGWFYRWVKFDDDVATKRAIEEANKVCKNVYFALGSFEKNEQGELRRKGANCVAMRSFFLDLDGGSDKVNKHDGLGVYDNPTAARAALGDFLRIVSLPQPTYVMSSGKGIHVYWALDADVPVKKWREYAQLLKDAHHYYKLVADPARTSDPASILRVPGTLHSTGTVVGQMGRAGRIVSTPAFLAALDNLRGVLGGVSALRMKESLFGLDEKPSYLHGELDVLAQPDFNQPKSFGKIIKLHEVEQSGCAQLYDLYVNQRTASEPLWAAALSICKFCVDGDEWSVKISEDYAGYDPYLTKKKMDQWDAPRTCAWFKSERPELCANCPHAAVAAQRSSFSPINIGLNPDEAPVEVKGRIAVKSAGSYTPGQEEVFTIPTMPKYFVRGENGGVFHRTADGELQQVYGYDFYIFDRIGFNAENIPRFWARLHSPQDGVIELELDSNDIYGSPADTVKKLAQKGVFVDPITDDAKGLSLYLKSSVSKLQREKPMAIAPNQLGWTDRGSFVMGRFEMRPGTQRAVPISSTNIAARFAEALTLRQPDDKKIKEWNDCLTTLYGAGDAALYRLILAAGVGSVIRSKHGDEVGGLLNMFSEDSGLGKTTLSKVMMSFYGDPAPFVLQAKHGATNTAFFETISYVNSLPLVLDETGQLDSYGLMEFIHTSTSGKPKLRGSASANDIRQTLKGWRTFVISSSNVSLWNRIVESRQENEAYLMRVVEIPLKRLAQHADRSLTDSAIRKLDSLHGVCNKTLINHILCNDDVLAGQWGQTANKLSKAAGLGAQHRFWVDILTAAVIGARVGYDAGVFPFDPNEVEATAVSVLVDMASRISDKVVKDEQLLADLINTNLDKMVVVNSITRESSELTTPRGEIQMRYEVDTGTVYIAESCVRQFAKEQQFGIERLENYLRTNGAQPKVRKALADNTGVGALTIPTNTWRITREVAHRLNINIKGEGMNAKDTSTDESPF